MSTGYDSTSPRFFRPTDIARIRRNQRRIQFQRLASIGGKVAVVAGIAIGSLLAYRHTQGDARFAVKSSLRPTAADHGRHYQREKQVARETRTMRTCCHVSGFLRVSFVGVFGSLRAAPRHLMSDGRGLTWRFAVGRCDVFRLRAS